MIVQSVGTGGEAAEEETTGLDLILPALAELIGGAICFAVVFFVMKSRSLRSAK